MLTLSEIFIYPVKSLGGISLQSSEVEERGLKFDRRYLLVDENGMFMTQRDYPQMALLKLSLAENAFEVIDIKNNNKTILPFESQSTKSIKVNIWDDVCNAVVVNKNLDVWFSEAISKKCSLVFMPDNEKRIVEKKYIADEHTVSFADGYPLLIVGQSSLDDLNSKLEIPIPMNRFRPNFVFTGGKSFEEDNWRKFKIGNAGFEAVKPCARCMITTTNQETGERENEPLKTLAHYRKKDGKVMFGMNVVCNKKGKVSVNETIVLY